MATNNNPLIVYSEIDPLFQQDTQGNLATVLNENAVKASIENILGTSRGSRIFLPQFASGLNSFLFDPINQRILDNFSDNMKETIELWDNRVNVQGVNLVTDPDNNTISATVSFSIVGFSQVLSHTVQIGGW